MDSAFAKIPDWYNGNIDLDNRELYRHPDGYIQTEHSFGTAFDPGDNYRIRLPQIVNGQPIGIDAARKHFADTGEHLGYDYRNENEPVSAFHDRIDKKDNIIHERQADRYRKEIQDWWKKSGAANR